MGSRPRVKRPCYGLTSDAPSASQEHTEPIGSPTLMTYGIRFGSADHRNKYQLLAQRQIMRTKFAHIDTLDKLGVTDGVRFLFRNVGWESLLRMTAEVYPRLTLEFLSSLQMSDSGLITFRLLDQDRQVSLAILNTMFEWPVDGTLGPTDPFPKEFNEIRFWNSVTGLHAYDPCHAKASLIRHPCLRIAHRIIACTMFARSDPGTVSRSELFILWAMVQKRSIVKLNTAAWLVHKFLRVRDSTSGEICVGGLITLLATRRPLSLQIPQYMLRHFGGTTLDIDILQRMHFIRQNNGRFMWLLGPSHTDYATLPDPSRTRVHGYTDWMFPNPVEEPVHDDDNVAGPSHSSSTHHSDLPPYILSRIEAFETHMNDVRAKVSEMRSMFPNPVEEPVHDDNAGSGPSHSSSTHHSDLPPNVLSRIEALETQMTDVRTEVSGTRSMIAEMHYWSQTTFNYHVSQGHFPDSRPPRPIQSEL